MIITSIRDSPPEVILVGLLINCCRLFSTSISNNCVVCLADLRKSQFRSPSIVISLSSTQALNRISGKCPPAIIAFTETWLDDTITNGEIAVQGYNVHRKDRNRHRGSIAVYVADRLKVTRRRSDLEMDDIELIWLELRETATRRALFGAAYRSSYERSCNH